MFAGRQLRMRNPAPHGPLTARDCCDLPPGAGAQASLPVVCDPMRRQCFHLFLVTASVSAAPAQGLAQWELKVTCGR